jgi:hypothetical protein
MVVLEVWTPATPNMAVAQRRAAKDVDQGTSKTGLTCSGSLLQCCRNLRPGKRPVAPFVRSLRPTNSLTKSQKSLILEGEWGDRRDPGA